MSNDLKVIECRHGRECGACGLLGMPYEEQLYGKRGVVERAIRQNPQLKSIPVLDCVPSPEVESYRNRAKMAVGMSPKSGTHVGYFRAGTREVVDAPQCRVLIPELLETTRRIRRVLEGGKRIPRELRHIDLRCGSDPRQQHLTLVFQSETLPKFPLDALLRACPMIDGVSANMNPSRGPQVIRGAIEHLHGEREVWVQHAGLRMRVSPGAFFQVNLPILHEIHKLMAEFFGHGQTLADLYSGVGTHGLAMRDRFQRIWFAEGNRRAIADLKSTLRASKIDDYGISAVAVERGLHKLREAKPDAVVLNPSRVGAREAVLDAISQTPAKKLAYLSCDPETLVRDLDILRRKKFTVESIQPIDMMPQTRQVEALALLTRK